MTSTSWYHINNIASFDSPALVLYKERVVQNIKHAVGMVGDPARLRPHVKTNKIAEVCRLMMDAGISKFKCATIAEAEMLAMIQAEDVLLAYQPVGIKIDRLVKLVKKYPATIFSCLVDNAAHASLLSASFAAAGITGNVFIDINVGMNRTGIQPAAAFHLFEHCLQLKNIMVIGLHGYDGHVIDPNPDGRKKESDKSFVLVSSIAEEIKTKHAIDVIIIAGGSPSFPVHAARKNIECSPGTFVFWDWGYKTKFPDEPFDFAALVITRVISIIDHERICVDLGHKSVAAEMPFPRVHFLNAPAAVAISQSEEHLILNVGNTAEYNLGDVLYGVPVHICPTVALHDKALVCTNNQITGQWDVVARKRMITI